MNPISTVYLKTTIPSYLTSRISSNLVVACHQQITQEWWEIRHDFELFIPDKASTDAFHIACATRHGIDFLLTWNCKHIANGTILKIIERIIVDQDAGGQRLPLSR